MQGNDNHFKKTSKSDLTIYFRGEMAEQFNCTSQQLLLLEMGYCRRSLYAQMDRVVSCEETTDG